MQPPLPVGFAHRGGLDPGPQNTLPTFASACAAGVAGLESDAWLTRDDVAVLDHDGLLPPDDTPITAVNRGDLPAYIPTLDELYDKCGTDFQLSIDILDDAALPRLVETAHRYGAANRLWIVARWPKPALWRERFGEDVHVVAGLGRSRLQSEFARPLGQIAARGCCAVNMHDVLWTRGRVAAVHHAGLLAFGWRANTIWQIHRLLRFGCDGVFSDSVPALLATTAPAPVPSL